MIPRSVWSLCTPFFCLRREPQQADLLRLHRLLVPLLMFTPAEIDMAVELLRERLEDGPGCGYDFVFLDAQGSLELEGFACYGRIPCTQSGWDLYWIAVRKQRQKSGLGRLVLAAVEEAIRLKGGGRLYAETSSLPRYAPTRGFYRNQGFRELARFPQFYALDDDKLVYEKIV